MLRSVIFASVMVLTFSPLDGSAALTQQARGAAEESGSVVGSELRIVAANVQLLLMAPDGKKTGYDPIARKKLRAIPRSAYYEDALLAFDSGRVDPNTTQTIDVMDPPAGKYRLEVSPGSAGDGEEYEVRLTVYGRDGGEKASARITGTARREKTAAYELAIGAAPDALKILVHTQPGAKAH